MTVSSVVHAHRAYGPAATRILDANAEASHAFMLPEAREEREEHRAQHSTNFLVKKCIDGRLNGPVYTDLAPGSLLFPMRGPGGSFDLRWSFYNHYIRELITKFKSQDREVCVVCSWHYDRFATDRGCAAFNHNSLKAKRSSHRLKKQYAQAFRKDPNIYAIELAFETFSEAFVLCGDNDEMVDLALMKNASISDVEQVVQRLWVRPALNRGGKPMPDRIQEDLSWLLMRNVQHSARVQQSERHGVDIEHHEWAIMAGQGFGWLHLLNQALIMNLFDPQWKKSYRTAAKVMMNNIHDSSRVDPKEGLIFTACVPYNDELGYDQDAAVFKAEGIARDGLKVIAKAEPQLMGHLEVMIATVNVKTMAMAVHNYEPAILQAR